MDLIYYPGHDERYAHIHPLVRKEFPDEIRIGHSPFGIVIKRVKNWKNLTAKDFRGYEGTTLPACLWAKDVSYRKGCIH